MLLSGVLFIISILFSGVFPIGLATSVTFFVIIVSYNFYKFFKWSIVLENKELKDEESDNEMELPLPVIIALGLGIQGLIITMAYIWMIAL